MNTDQHGLIHQDLTERIIGLFFDVYNELGYGFLESVYEQRQVPTPVWFRGQQIGDFRCDLLVEAKLLLELKAARAIEKAHEARLLNYSKATDVEVGLLLNFGEKPQFRRLLFDNPRKKSHPASAGSVTQGI
jgi:GxxExxY protein